MSSGFSHFDDSGNVVMVDVSDKPETRREAVAEGRVLCNAETLGLIRQGGVKRATCFLWPGSPASWAPSRPPR